MQDRGNWPRVAQVVGPHFELQPGNPLERCLSIHLPRTNLDKEELLKVHKVAVQCGAMLTVVYTYRWDLARLIE